MCVCGPVSLRSIKDAVGPTAAVAAVASRYEKGGGADALYYRERKGETTRTTSRRVTQEDRRVPSFLEKEEVEEEVGGKGTNDVSADSIAL